MLFWLNFFLTLLTLLIFSLYITYSSVLILLLTSELLIVFLFLIYCFLSIYFNINFILVIGLIYLIIGGTELVLNVLILVL